MSTPPRVIRVRPLDDFRLELGFTDGTSGVVDASRWIVGHGGVFGPLNDPAVFAQVVVDPEAGTVVWPTGADLCPDVLFAAARAERGARGAA
jgi:hypothetical protein